MLPEIFSEYLLEDANRVDNTLLFCACLRVEHDREQLDVAGFLFDLCDKLLDVLDILVIILIEAW